MPIILVSYDISDNERRNSVRDRLKSMGFTMVQRSLYATRGGGARAKDVSRALTRYVSHSEDSIIIFLLPIDVVSRAIVIGLDRLPRRDDIAKII